MLVLFAENTKMAAKIAELSAENKKMAAEIAELSGTVSHFLGPFSN